jgi:hypothetical protein
MIDSIGSSVSFRPPPPNSAGSNNALNSEQTSLIEETLSGYDAKNLTEQDAQSIVETFTDAGINPSAQFEELLTEAGFDARELGSLAGVGEGNNGPSGGQRPPPQGQSDSQGLDLSSVVDYLDNLSESTESNWSDNSSLTAMLAEKFGLSEGQSLINITA